MQNVVGSYLEQSLKMLSTQQQQIRDELRNTGQRRLRRHQLAHAEEHERWRSVQNDIFKAMSGGRGAGKRRMTRTERSVIE